MLDLDDGQSLTDLREEEPEALIIALSEVLQGDQIDQQEVLALAGMLADDAEINMFRLLDEHPDLAEECFGLEAVPQSLIDKVDRAME